MAVISISKFSCQSILLLFVLSATTFSATATSTKEFIKETRMSMYLQDFTSGPNLTDIPIAGIAGKAWTFGQFGTFVVNDNPLTVGQSPDTEELGRAQGLFVASGRSSGYIAYSVVFTNKEYNGSTLEIQGTSMFEAVREVPVVAGTGKFRFARGYATLETVLVDSENDYGVVLFNITVQHM